MARRHDFSYRLLLRGDETLATRYVDAGRCLLGALLESLGEAGLRSGTAAQRYPNAAVIASYDGTVASIVIDATGGGANLVLQTALWIPHGFVVEPGGPGAVLGWGVPVIPPGSGGDYTLTQPGADVSHWTIGGAMPQVLVSKDANAGYLPPGVEPLPMYADSKEWGGKDYKAPLTGGWAVYRPEFVIRGSEQALLDALNALRPSDKPLSPPFRGFADLANWYWRWRQVYGDADSGWPPGSNTWYKRVEKDGTAAMPTVELPIGVIGVANFSGVPAAEDAAAMLVAALPSLADPSVFTTSSTFSVYGSGEVAFSVADHENQWIRCGNTDWRSIHPEVPPLSWFTLGGRNVPYTELIQAQTAEHDAIWSYNGGTYFQYARADVMLDNMPYHDYGMSNVKKPFTPYVFSRGRILGAAPDNGVVLSAAIQKLDADFATGAVLYRLVVITWHNADQFTHEAVAGARVAALDRFSDIRVYYADLPTAFTLAAVPDRLVSELYDAVTNPYGWHLSARHRLWFSLPYEYEPGYTSYAQHSNPNYQGAAEDYASYGGGGPGMFTPKGYWHLWNFNGSGTKATCVLAQWESYLYTSMQRAAPGIVVDMVLDKYGASSTAVAYTYYTRTLLGEFNYTPVPIVWDYRGDDLVHVYALKIGPEFVQILDSDMRLLFEGSLDFTTSPVTFAMHLDPRTDTYLLSALVLTTLFEVTAASLRLIVAGAEKSPADITYPAYWVSPRPNTFYAEVPVVGLGLGVSYPFDSYALFDVASFGSPSFTFVGGTLGYTLDMGGYTNYCSIACASFFGGDGDVTYVCGARLNYTPACVGSIVSDPGLQYEIMRGTWDTPSGAHWTNTDSDALSQQGQWLNFAGVV